MTQPASNVRHLHPVPLGGEVPADGPQTLAEALDQIRYLSRRLSAAGGIITKLEREKSQTQALEPEADQILDVLTHWRNWCMPGARIVVGSDRWTTVRALLRMKDAETGEAAYTPLSLKAAAIGVKLSDWHVREKKLDIFNAKKGDNLTARIDAHIGRAIGFKRTYGISALEIVDVLGGEALKMLAERCGYCDGFWFEHLYHGGPTPDGRQPCSARGCPDFDWFAAKAARHMAELEARAADGDRESRASLEYARWLDREAG